jgi:hypothetical protein
VAAPLVHTVYCALSMTFAATRETVFGEQATGMFEEIVPSGFIGEGSRLYGERLT